MTREQTPEQIAEMVEEKLGGKPNITIECTGAESCIQVLKEEKRCFLNISIDRNLRDEVWRMSLTSWTGQRNGKPSDCQCCCSRS